MNEIKKDNLINKKKKNKAKMTQSLTEYHASYAKGNKIKKEDRKVKVEEIENFPVKQEQNEVKNEQY